MTNLARTPVPAVGIVCFREESVLLIRRAKPPLEGQWSLPGGRIEWGEPAAQTAARELKEETGVEADLIGLIDVVDAIFGDSHYLLIDYAARWRAGEPAPGDDASEARFAPFAELESLGLWGETLRVIRAGAALALAARSV